MKKHLVMPSPVGSLVLVADDEGLLSIDLWGRPALVPAGRSATLAEAERQLTEWFAGERTRFELPLCPEGTPFQRRVWEALCAIPYGETRSYGEIARAIDAPSAVRAVGGANRRNPLPIVVPCHRVIGADGALTGFAGGLETKRWLLSHEAQRLTRAAAPTEAALPL